MPHVTFQVSWAKVKHFSLCYRLTVSRPGILKRQYLSVTYAVLQMKNKIAYLYI
jgi:hypothetical protein